MSSCRLAVALTCEPRLPSRLICPGQVLAPIYYVFCLELEWARKASAEATAAAAFADGGGEGGGGEAGAALDPEEEAAAAAAVEADAFFCFTNLMAEVRDHFCAKLDHTELGITAKIQNLETLLQKKDPELAALLKSLRVGITLRGSPAFTPKPSSQDLDPINCCVADVFTTPRHAGAAPSFYGFRWLTLLMTQEFDLPDVLRLWDSLLADTQRFVCRL